MKFNSYGISWVTLLGVIILGITLSGLPAEEVSYQAITDRFFKLLLEDNPNGALDYIFSTNPSFLARKDSVPESKHLGERKDQFLAMASRIGAYISHSKLIEFKAWFKSG